MHRNHDRTTIILDYKVEAADVAAQAEILGYSCKRYKQCKI